MQLIIKFVSLKSLLHNLKWNEVELFLCHTFNNFIRKICQKHNQILKEKIFSWIVMQKIERKMRYISKCSWCIVGRKHRRKQRNLWKNFCEFLRIHQSVETLIETCSLVECRTMSTSVDKWKFNSDHTQIIS